MEYETTSLKEATSLYNQFSTTLSTQGYKTGVYVDLGTFKKMQKLIYDYIMTAFDNQEKYQDLIYQLREDNKKLESTICAINKILTDALTEINNNYEIIKK